MLHKASCADHVEPAYLWVPDNAGTFGDEVIGLAELAGIALDCEQEQVINAWLVHDDKGDWCASEVCIIEPRQNGKTNAIMVPVALADLFMFGRSDDDDIIWTAHRYKTTDETFEYIRGLIDGTFELRRRVKRISESHGDSEIELTNGRKMLFLARSTSGGRGLGGKRPVLDEAFALVAGQMGALLPTILARPNAQIVYGSSAGLAMSHVLREVRDRGRKGGDPNLVYAEFCAPGSWEKPGCKQLRCNHHRDTAGCALDRTENHRAGNPAYKRRIMPRAIATMRRSLTPQEFGREVCGWWDEPDASDIPPITIERWNVCRDDLSRVHGKVCIALDVSPNLSTGAIAVCGKRSDGILHGELIDYRNGTEWMVDALVDVLKDTKIINMMRKKERVPGIVLDPTGAAGSLLPELQARGIEPILVTTRDLGAACGGLQRDVLKGKDGWRHIGQTQVDIAVEGARRRDIGDGGWAFGRNRSADASADIAPLVAVALARWGFTMRAKPTAVPDFAWSEE